LQLPCQDAAMLLPLRHAAMPLALAIAMPGYAATALMMMIDADAAAATFSPFSPWPCHCRANMPLPPSFHDITLSRHFLPLAVRLYAISCRRCSY